MKGVSILKLHVYERVTLFWEKNTMQKGKYIDLGQSLFVYTLVRPPLPPPGHSYIEKAYITVNKKHLALPLGSNSKAELNFLGTPKM